MTDDRERGYRPAQALETSFKAPSRPVERRSGLALGFVYPPPRTSLSGPRPRRSHGVLDCPLLSLFVLPARPIPYLSVGIGIGPAVSRISYRRVGHTPGRPWYKGWYKRPSWQVGKPPPGNIDGYLCVCPGQPSRPSQCQLGGPAPSRPSRRPSQCQQAAQGAQGYRRAGLSR